MLRKRWAYLWGLYTRGGGGGGYRQRNTVVYENDIRKRQSVFIYYIYNLGQNILTSEVISFNFIISVQMTPPPFQCRRYL